MKHNFIWKLNVFIAFLIASALIGSFFVQINRNEFFQQPPIEPSSRKLPSSSFALSQAAYKDVGSSVLALQFQLPKIRLPDLRPILQFHGHNARPDASLSEELFFSLGIPTEMIVAHPKKPIYLKGREGGGYTFSSENQPTDLWFEPTLQGNQALIQVRIRDDEGQVQMEPKERANFILAEKPLTQATVWNIDKWRVDGTLFARQKARWSGRDLFLEQHGGADYQPMQGKQRIAFGEGSDLYAVYVDRGDILIWKEGKWVSAKPSKETQGYPLLRVNKLEERLMSFELFDLSGKRKITLNLLKSQDRFPQVAVQNDFQFIGARTHVHSMFKVQKQREMVGPGDWFLLTPEGWKKIKTGQEIDQFVEGKWVGPLLIINRIEKQNEYKWLAATLFNAARSESMPIEIPLGLKEKPTEEEKIPPAEPKRDSDEKLIEIPTGASPVKTPLDSPRLEERRN